MLHVSRPEIRNVKIAIKVDISKYCPSVLKRRTIETGVNTKHYHNFSIIRTQYVYSVFWKSGYINITKIPDLHGIEKAVSHISSILSIDRDHIQPHTIHNICASGDFSRTFNLSRLKKALSKEKDINVSRNLSAFPALFLRYPNLGTCVLFQNGKYSLVGVNEDRKLTHLIRKVTHKIRQHELLP